jgi:adenylate cyclase
MAGGGGEELPADRLVRATQSRLFWMGWIANAAGVVVVTSSIGFLVPIFLDTDDLGRLALLNLPLLAVYFLVGGLVVTRAARRSYAAATDWIAEGRSPDDREHRLTLRHPLHVTRLTAYVWAAGTTLFTAINATQSLGFAAVAGATAWLGAETTCALAYLISEQILRPLTARALAERLPPKPFAPGVRDRLLFAWALGTGAPILGVLVVGVVGLTKSGVDTGYVAAACLFLSVVALSVGLLVTLFAARAIADPVTSVRAGLERVERGELDVHVPVDDGSEVGQLQAGFNRMAEGLRERRQLRDLFGRQVGEDVARAALRNGTRLGGEEREVGALFVDVTGSTSMALAMPPSEVVRLLNLFFRVVVEVVEAEGGIVNKFEGDAALCVFGAPVANDDPAGDALRAARRLAERLSREVPQIEFGIGVSAGRAVAGNVGSEQRFEYTVIGDPVNEAARLCELAKRRPERVLASAAALGRAAQGESGSWSLGEAVTLRGRGEPTPLASPIGGV